MTDTGTRPRGVAMTDVAQLAGVSHQTVSRVLNDHPNVRAQTRLRVLAAMTELGYRPNRAARALATGRSQTVGVVAQNSTLFGPASLLAAVEYEAAAAGLAVGVASVRELDQASISSAVERHLEHRVAGIVIIAPVETAAAAIAAIPSTVPLVAIDGDPRSDTSLVTVDQAEGARLATETLLAAGHETVWHVAGPADWFDSQGRLAGWRATLERAGAEVPPHTFADWSPAAGYSIGRMLAHVSEITAIFAANDHLALGIMKALRERGRRVPEDVSIVGFDDIPEAGYLVPPLTTIRPDFAAVAQASLQLLSEQIESGGQSSGSRTIAPTLVERDSVAPPPR